MKKISSFIVLGFTGAVLLLSFQNCGQSMHFENGVAVSGKISEPSIAIPPSNENSLPEAGPASPAPAAARPVPAGTVLTFKDTCTFVVPVFNSMKVEVWGAGGGGGLISQTSVTRGSPGAKSVFASQIANGGAAGNGAAGTGPSSGGLAMGGDQNFQGGNSTGLGAFGPYGAGYGRGGSAPHGGSGGVSLMDIHGKFPGGGGAGAILVGFFVASGGSAGGYSVKTYRPATFPFKVGDIVPCEVGKPGKGAPYVAAPLANTGSGGDGAGGQVKITFGE